MWGLALIVLVVLVVFVNGFTDAPNAITGVVSTGALPYRKAVRLAAVCNLGGIVCMSLVSSSVADTISSIADLGESPGHAMAALCAAMASIVILGVAAWGFGIPTSESHALIAGLTGAALALGGTAAVHPGAWEKVLWGLVWSLALGFGLGFGATKLLRRPLGRMGGRNMDRLQILSAGGMAFAHGAQDGQKFAAVLVLADLLVRGWYRPGPIAVGGHPGLLLVAGAVMALGTMAGGRRIIRRVGEKMVPLEKYQGVCSDLGGALCLLTASLWGIPMSTTHTKTSAILGAGIAGNRSRVGLRSAGGIVFAWAVTFPVCGGLGYLLTKLLTSIM